MKFVRYGEGQYGILENDTVYAASGDPFAGGLVKGAAVGPVASVKLLPPVVPGKMLCIGMNFVKHVTELDPTREIPKDMVTFMKPQSTLIGHGDTILIANPAHDTHYEAELVVVIGKTAKNVAESDALDYVLGYTVGNDVSDRNLQRQDGQWTRAKGFDTYCPLGPCVAVGLDISNIKIMSRLNGETRQSSDTPDMIFKVPFLVSSLSKVMTLNPGDIILTGTPAGVGNLKAGDVIECEVEGVGVLRNPVANR